MDLKQIQSEVNQRWDKQLDNPCHCSADPEHALVHIMKAAGKVASALNDSLHEKRKMRPEDVAKFLADLVICASRFACGVEVDLDAAVVSRIAEKFPVRN